MMREKFVYLPTVVSNPPEITSDALKETHIQGKYPCPCCKYITFPVPPNEAVAYICPVCYWENDVFIWKAFFAREHSLYTVKGG